MYSSTPKPGKPGNRRVDQPESDLSKHLLTVSALTDRCYAATFPDYELLQLGGAVEEWVAGCVTSGRFSWYGPATYEIIASYKWSGGRWMKQWL